MARPAGRRAERLLAEGREVVVAQRHAPAAICRSGATFVACDALDREAVVKTAGQGGQFVVTIGFVIAEGLA